MNLKQTFTTLVIAFAVVSFWRGVWGLMDIYLFPNTPWISFTISILIGIIAIYLIKHRLKPLL